VQSGVPGVSSGRTAGLATGGLLVGVAAALAFRATGSLNTKPVATLAIADASKALPFMKRPPNLKGQLVGDAGFDPLEISTYFDVNKMRESELWHGRFSMLATVGFVFPSVFGKFPIFQDVSTNPIEAVTQVPEAAALVLLPFIIAERNRYDVVFGDKPYVAGENGFDPLEFLSGKSDEEKREMQEKELTNGRLAMISLLIMCTQLQSGELWPFQFGLDKMPLSF